MDPPSHRSTPPSRSFLGSERNPASVPPGDPELHLSAAETVAELLESYGRLAFDTAQSRAADVTALCMRWAASATRNAPGRKMVLQGTHTSPARTDWGGLLGFFRETRHGEVHSVLQARSDLTDTVQGFARIFHRVLLQERSLDADCAKALVRLSGALATPGDEPLVAAANDLVSSVGQLLRARNRASSERLQALKDHVRQLEQTSGSTCFHNPFELDAETGLHNAAAFLEHLSFLALTGSLFDRPPLLIALRVHLLAPRSGHSASTLEDETPWLLAEELSRAFPSRHCFLARPEQSLLTVVCAAIDLGEAHAAVRSLLTSSANHPLLLSTRLRAGLASNVPGEDSSAWHARALDALGSAADFECVIAAAPAQFEDRA